MFVCPKELGTLHTRLTKLVLLCQKSQQILSAPNLKIVLSCAHFQTTKYLITSVNDIEIEHLSLGSVCAKAYVYMPITILQGKHWLAVITAHTLFYFFHHYCLCHSSSSLKKRSKISLVDWQEERSFSRKIVHTYNQRFARCI